MADGQTDRQTDRQTNRKNYDPQDRASIAASRGKIRATFGKVIAKIQSGPELMKHPGYLRSRETLKIKKMLPISTAFMQYPL